MRFYQKRQDPFLCDTLYISVFDTVQGRFFDSRLGGLFWLLKWVKHKCFSIITAYITTFLNIFFRCTAMLLFTKFSHIFSKLSICEDKSIFASHQLAFLFNTSLDTFILYCIQMTNWFLFQKITTKRFMNCLTKESYDRGILFCWF